MNKKQRNKKLIAQNKRNRMFNRRYSSTIKTLSKLFRKTTNNLTTSNNADAKEKIKANLLSILNNLYSFLDKAVKKRVIHKNKAARKKSSVGKLINNI